jgi:hypothetical protein
MSNKRITAVEWLIEQIKSDIFCDHIQGVQYWDKDTLIEFLEQAKAMEREQIIEAIDYFNARPHTDITAEEYYNENYDIHTEESED